jgi:hypothetical protein
LGRRGKPAVFIACTVRGIWKIGAGAYVNIDLPGFSGSLGSPIAPRPEHEQFVPSLVGFAVCGRRRQALVGPKGDVHLVPQGEHAGPVAVDLRDRIGFPAHADDAPGRTCR